MSKVKIASKKLKVGELQIMGVLNVTPDSFSDGGRFFSVKKAIAQGLKMARQGADIIDVGGESSGPGSVYVSEEEELRRVIPVIMSLRALLAGQSNLDCFVAPTYVGAPRNDIKISIDTYKARVAQEAIKAGANMINDVTALRGDPQMASVIAKSDAQIVLMYSKDKTVRTTRLKKHYKDIISTIKNFLKERIEFARRSGIKKRNIIIDPGMGAFLSAVPRYSYEVLQRLGELKTLGVPILVATSRKSFLGGGVRERLLPTVISNMLACINGAAIIRVHDVLEHKHMLDFLRSVKIQQDANI